MNLVLWFHKSVCYFIILLYIREVNVIELRRMRILILFSIKKVSTNRVTVAYPQQNYVPKINECFSNGNH